jgi:large subunit ribosomal protein L7/L12
MAKMSTDQLLDAFKEMTLIELSDFVKKFEETFEVTAAAPAAMMVAAAVAPRRRSRPRRRRTSSTSSSSPMAARRSRSSRLCASSPVWV